MHASNMSPRTIEVGKKYLQYVYENHSNTQCELAIYLREPWEYAKSASNISTLYKLKKYVYSACNMFRSHKS